MAKKLGEPSEKFKLKIANIFVSAVDDINALETLGRLLRTYETANARLERYIKYLRTKIRGLIRDLGITEHNFGRLQIKRINVWKIPDDKAGEVIYQKFVDAFGEEKTEQWITVGEKEIPAEKVKTYSLSEEGKADIKKLGYSNKAQDLIGKWHFKIGPRPKKG